MIRSYLFARSAAVSRTKTLFARQLSAAEREDPKPEAPPRESRPPGNRLEEFLDAGTCALSPTAFAAISLFSASAVAYIAAQLLSLWFLPLFFAFGLVLPRQWVEARARHRVVEFASDYPAMLLAAASSLKVGLTPYEALERSTKLLAPASLVRREVETLVGELQRGTPREQAVSNFARTIRLPELALFRSAFLIVLENGGRFSPTLLRLAAVSNNRAQLVRSAAVSTASMRMTANILIVVAPILVLLLAARTEGYWETFFHHPVANALASTGIVVITGCYLLLRSMSKFKP